MKKKIIIISVVLIGFIVALSSNSWAQRERGGDRRPDGGNHFQKWKGSGDHNFDRDRIPNRGPRVQSKPHFNRPGSLVKSKFHKRQHYRPPYRYKPKFKPWFHRPIYRHGYPNRFYRRPHHSMVKEINNYYGSTESYYAPEDEFTASATITDTGFAFSVGVKETN